MRTCLERAEAGGLRRDPVGLLIRHRTWHGRRWTLGQHQPRATQDRCVVLFGLLCDFALLALLVVLLEHLDRTRLLAQEVDHVGHGEIVKAVAPRDLHDHIGTDKVVAGIQHTNVAFPAANVHKLKSKVSKVLPQVGCSRNLRSEGAPPPPQPCPRAPRSQLHPCRACPASKV